MENSISGISLKRKEIACNAFSNTCYAYAQCWIEFQRNSKAATISPKRDLFIFKLNFNSPCKRSFRLCERERESDIVFRWLVRKFIALKHYSTIQQLFSCDVNQRIFLFHFHSVQWNPVDYPNWLYWRNNYLTARVITNSLVPVSILWQLPAYWRTVFIPS